MLLNPPLKTLLTSHWRMGERWSNYGFFCLFKEFEFRVRKETLNYTLAVDNHPEDLHPPSTFFTISESKMIEFTLFFQWLITKRLMITCFSDIILLLRLHNSCCKELDVGPIASTGDPTYLHRPYHRPSMIGGSAEYLFSTGWAVNNRHFSDCENW